jgi:hypothetical protein
MCDTPPAILYKYRPINENTLSCLVREVLWFASPDTFNDPFDGYLESPKRGEYEQFTTALGANLSNANPFGDKEVGHALVQQVQKDGTASAVTTIRSYDFELQGKLEAEIKRRGVFSGSSTPRNILMWSHYANHHQGVCIGYRVDYSALAPAYVRQVRYPSTDDREILEHADLANEDCAIDKLLTYKSKLWVYEEEWRLILKDKLEPGAQGCEVALQALPGKIEEVIFGMRTPQRHIDTLLKILGPKSFKKAVAGYRKYQINILDYSARHPS